MPRQKTLTPKEVKAIDFLLQGMSQYEAVKQAYDCKTDASARSLSCRVFKRELVRSEISKRQEQMSIELAGQTRKFIEYLGNKIAKREVADRLVDIINSKDNRPALKAIDVYLKLFDEYPEQKTKVMGLFGALKNKDEEVKEDKKDQKALKEDKNNSHNTDKEH